MRATELIDALRADGTGRVKLQDLTDLLARGEVGIDAKNVDADTLHRVMTDSGKFTSATIDKACRLVKGQPEPAKAPPEVKSKSHQELREAEGSEPAPAPKAKR